MKKTNDKGITLITLIITIVIMLILVGITVDIYLRTENSIIEESKQVVNGIQNQDKEMINIKEQVRNQIEKRKKEE